MCIFGINECALHTTAYNNYVILPLTCIMLRVLCTHGSNIVLENHSLVQLV